MKPDLGMVEEDRHGVAEILDARLADEYVRYTKTRDYRWNVVGPAFGALHTFFEEPHNARNDVVDAVAERARTLGAPSFGTLAEFLKHARLRERPGEVLTAKEMIDHLLRDPRGGPSSGRSGGTWVRTPRTARISLGVRATAMHGTTSGAVTHGAIRAGCIRGDAHRRAPGVRRRREACGAEPSAPRSR